MITAQEQTQENPDNQAPLIPLSDFRKSGRAPVEMHHLIFYNKDSLVKYGVICKFCLLYTSPSPRDKRQSRMPSSA